MERANGQFTAKTPVLVPPAASLAIPATEATMGKQKAERAATTANEAEQRRISRAMYDAADAATAPAKRGAVSVLWDEYSRLITDARRLARERDRISRAVMRRMPKLPADLLPCKANEAVGLTQSRDPETCIADVQSRYGFNENEIRAELRYCGPSTARVIFRRGTRFILSGPKPFKMTAKEKKEDAARTARLNHLLELRLRYTAERKRREKEAGYPAAEEAVANAYGRANKVARRIVAARAVTVADFAAKASLFDEWSGEGSVGRSIVRDIRWLASQPTDKVAVH